MNIRRFSTGLLMGLLILAACVPAPNPGDYEWCYYYNFTIFDYDATITNGEWVDGVGIVSDDGEPPAIVFSITKSGLSVQPELVSLSIARPEGNEETTYGNGSASIYEVDAKTGFTLVPEWTDETIYAENTDGDYGNLIYVEIQSSAQLAVTGISVHGNGPTPFEQNPCAPNTPTSTASATTEATATYTPSITPTPTNTFTPSPTPTTWEWEWNNEDGQCGFTIRDTGYGVWDSAGGTGFKRVSNTSNPDGIYIIKSDILLTTATTVTYMYFRITPAASVVYAGRAYFFFGTGTPVENISSQDFPGGATAKEWNTTQTRNGYLGVGFDPYLAGVHPNGMWTIDRVVFQGSGTNPFAEEDCTPATATPTPTSTSTATNTPTPTPTRTNLPAPSTPTPSRTPLVPATWTPRPTNTPLATNTPLPTNTPVPTITPIPATITATSSATPVTHTPEFTYTTIPTGTYTPFGTAAGTPWGTPIEWGTPWGTPNATSVGEATGLPPYEFTPDTNDVISFLETAAAEINELPGSIDNYVPDVDGTDLFGYMKWAISCTSAQELVGQTLSPIICHAMVGFSLNIFLATIFLSFRLIRLLLKIITWIVSNILKIIPFMG